MESKRFSGRLIYLAMSLFVGWHATAMLVAPMPGNNEMLQSLRRLFAPYLNLFRLDNEWGFFAPNVGKSHQFQYVIRDTAGKDHTFVPINELRRFNPLYMRLMNWYEHVMYSPDAHAAFAADFFCRKHANLKPVSVTFLEIAENDFWPEDRLRGKHPRDPDYVTVKNVITVKCQH
jgi:hypothetical protein